MARTCGLKKFLLEEICNYSDLESPKFLQMRNLAKTLPEKSEPESQGTHRLAIGALVGQLYMRVVT